MEIINVSYSWAHPLTYSNTPKQLILHHAAASVCDAQTIDKWHKTRGWAGIGYHYFVRKDGRIFKGRPDNAIGAQCLNHNTNTLGICAEGNFETEQMGDVQKKALGQLVEYLKKKYGISTSNVFRHKDLNQTACPGKNYPFDYIKTYATPVPVIKKVEEVLNNMDIKRLQTWLNKNGFTDENGHVLVVDGKAGAHTMAAKAKAKAILTYILK